MEESIRGQISQAIDDFREARRKAALESILAPLRGKPVDLLSYDEVRLKLRAIESARRDLENIPLDKIVGSVNRYTDFSRSFLPRKATNPERWARVRVGVNSMLGLPPIEAYKVGDAYFVLDGHHRVSVAREMGQKSIQGYVMPVQVRVPLSPDDDPDDLILKAEYADFLNSTNLDKLRPAANLIVTAPGQYQKLLEHISVHRYFMGQQRNADVPYSEAVADWYDTVYQPVAALIRERNLLRDFPGRTEADLYLWIMDHRSSLSQGDLDWQVRPELAAADLAERFSPTARRRLPRLAHRFMDLIIPDPLESGPPPGAWRSEHQSPHRGDRLFDDLLVSVPGGTGVPGGDGRWSAVTVAIQVAKKESARLTGLHVVSSDDLQESPAVTAIRDEFMRLCAEAGIFGRLLVETGSAARLLVQRSPLVDLVVFRLSFPPPTQPIQRLRSGARLLIQRSRSPILAVPDAARRMESAMLAYGPGRKADEALYVATYIAGSWKIPLTVITPHLPARAGQASPPSPSAQRERARQYLESHSVQARYIEETGEAAKDPAQTVLLNAEGNCDFIIMGGYEYNPLVESLLGSPVDRVLRSTRRPVLICG